MRAVIQRVKEASVVVDDRDISSIGQGLLILLGVARTDTEEDAIYMADKVGGFRIFEDSSGKMNLSIKDIKGEILVVSQFTIVADTRKGRRPSFDPAAPPEKAVKLYDTFTRRLVENGHRVKTGVFQAHMLVKIWNDGPVTFIVESR